MFQVQKWHFCHFKCQFTFEALSIELLSHFIHITLVSFSSGVFLSLKLLIAFALYSFIMSQPKTPYLMKALLCAWNLKFTFKKQILWIPLAWEQGTLTFTREGGSEIFKIRFQEMGNLSETRPFSPFIIVLLISVSRQVNNNKYPTKVVHLYSEHLNK